MNHRGSLENVLSPLYAVKKKHGELMSRDDPQFKLRLPADLKAKLDQRAKMNGRSINAELVQIVQVALSEPSPVSGYRDDAERLADQQAEQFKKVVFDTLKGIYSKGS